MENYGVLIHIKPGTKKKVHFLFQTPVLRSHVMFFLTSRILKLSERKRERVRKKGESRMTVYYTAITSVIY